MKGGEVQMKVGIMQPTYLPWAGYFEMISKVDLFILLDNVQFEKQSWQQRNRIRNASGEMLLTVPVKTAARFPQKICDVEINQDSNFARKHIESIRHSYSKTIYFDEFFPDLCNILKTPTNSLALYNESLIRLICTHLQISTEIIRASDLTSRGKGTELSVMQCKEVGADSYYAAQGSKNHITTQIGFAENGIAVEFQNYAQRIYPQIHGAFIQSLSAVDLIFNCGRNSMSFII